MSIVNQVRLLGHLGNDPEVKPVGENQVVTFNLATTDKWKDKQGKEHENTEWHNIVLWGGLSKVASEYLKKGHQVIIEGSINYRSWDDADGNKKYRTEIKGNALKMIGKPKVPTRDDIINSGDPSQWDGKTNFSL